jgi:hypothetical protein
MQDLDALIERIRGRITNFQDPEACWLWTGSRTSSGPRLQMMRSRDRTPFFQPVVARPFGVVRVGKNQRKVVHKIVYEWATKNVPKSDKYRLFNGCGDTLCCNPSHWVLKDTVAERFNAQNPEAKSAEEIDREARRDCSELLESLLATTEPRCFTDIQNHPYMVDFQPRLIQEVLRDIGKPHLCE